MDKVFIKDLRVAGIIGIYERERTTPQEMIINVTMFTNTSKAARSDSIEDCVDYEKVANKVRQRAETAKRLTVEALAEDLSIICLETQDVERVVIRVEKTEAIAGAASVGVEIERVKTRTH